MMIAPGGISVARVSLSSTLVAWPTWPVPPPSLLTGYRFESSGVSASTSEIRKRSVVW